jgi:tellurite methyltransferase
LARNNNDHAAPDWDERYRTGSYDGLGGPHDLVIDFAHLLEGKRTLDIAMGRGRDALYLASRGVRMTGMELSCEVIRLARDEAGRQALAVDVVRADAKALPFKKGVFGGVIIFFFLLREIARDIADMLEPGGILIYETFLKRQNEVDRQRNPAFLLDDGELLRLFPGFKPIHYEEGAHDRSGKTRITAQLVARKI